MPLTSQYCTITYIAHFRSQVTHLTFGRKHLYSSPRDGLSRRENASFLPSTKYHYSYACWCSSPYPSKNKSSRRSFTQVKPPITTYFSLIISRAKFIVGVCALDAKVPIPPVSHVDWISRLGRNHVETF